MEQSPYFEKVQGEMNERGAERAEVGGWSRGAQISNLSILNVTGVVPQALMVVKRSDGSGMAIASTNAVGEHSYWS